MKTIRLRMRETQSGMFPGFFAGTGQFHCRLGHEYDVPEELALAWLRKDPPAAERVRVRKVKVEPEENS